MERELGDMLTSEEEGRIHRVNIEKVSKGSFHTVKDSWYCAHVENFITNAGSKFCLDPYAGNGDMLNVINKSTKLQTIGLDIDSELQWNHNDSCLLYTSDAADE